MSYNVVDIVACAVIAADCDGKDVLSVGRGYITRKVGCRECFR